MFHLPDAKRVRRHDLYASDGDEDTPSSPIDDTNTRAKHLQDQLAQLYGPITLPPPNPNPAAQADRESSSQDPRPAEAEDDTYEFRLFGPPTTAITSNADSPSTAAALAPTQRVVLSNSDDECQGDGGFTVPHRRLSWYIATRATGAKKAEFEDAAVSAEILWRWKTQRAWALEKPWKVMVIGTASKQAPRSAALSVCATAKSLAGGGVDEKTRRTKPNKKRRILLRLRERALAEKLEAERLRRVREEEERANRSVEDVEKRTARNREKKAKKKAREKRKKAAAAAAGLPDPSGNASSCGSDTN